MRLATKIKTMSLKRHFEVAELLVCVWFINVFPDMFLGFKQDCLLDIKILHACAINIQLREANLFLYILTDIAYAQICTLEHNRGFNLRAFLSPHENV